ncbi:MAG: GIY-YIG nuclease family protein [Candidatus Omnitrophica bacterium]|nr:GIY-YIG nuclease family protein [Candidatus Omnitrophota bacterium]
MWHTYILSCKDGSFYVGSTTDISRRLDEHNSGKGGAYTRARHPVEIVYKEEWPDRSSAQKREAQIKRWTRLKKKAFIAQTRSAPSKKIIGIS